MSVRKIADQRTINADKLDELNALKEELKQIDNQSVRSMRAKLAGTATADDEQFLKALEDKAAPKRARVVELSKALGLIG